MTQPIKTNSGAETVVGDYDAICRVVQLCLDGESTGNVQKLREAFHEDARMFGSLAGERYDVPISELFDLAASSPADTGNYRARILSVHQTADAAFATVAEEGYWGTVSFTDYLSLARINGMWKIVNKLFAHTGVACWGYNVDGQATPPAGTFSLVSAGGVGVAHTCGVKAKGTVACWGNNGYGQATPPGGTFSSVSAGGSHTCGVKSDGTVACWGDDSFGQSTPPPFGLSSVDAGGQFTMGTSGGALVFWGNW